MYCGVLCLVPRPRLRFAFVRSRIRRCCAVFMLTNASTARRNCADGAIVAIVDSDVPATLLPQDECEGFRRKSPPGDRSGSQAGVRCRGMSPWGFDDGCSAQVGYLLYGDLQTERRYVWPRHKKCAVPMCRFDSIHSVLSPLRLIRKASILTHCI